MVGSALGKRKDSYLEKHWKKESVHGSECQHFCRLGVSTNFKELLLPDCLIFLYEIEAWSYPKSEGTQTVKVSLNRERVVGGRELSGAYRKISRQLGVDTMHAWGPQSTKLCDFSRSAQHPRCRNVGDGQLC